MKSSSYFSPVCKVIFFIIVAIYISVAALSQTIRKFEEHEVIDIGNGMKLEILRSRGLGENEEWDVIYYTDKRQLGKRKWEKTSKIIELEQAAKAQSKPQAEVKEPQASTKVEAKKPSKTNNIVIAQDSIKQIKPSAKVVDQKTSSKKKPVKNEVKTVKDKPVDTTSKHNAVVVQKEQGVPEANIKEAPKTVDTVTSSFPAVKVAPAVDSVANGAGLIKKPTTENSLPRPNITTTNSSITKVVHTLADCYQFVRNDNLALKQANNLIASNVIDHKIAQNSLLPSVSYNLGHYFSFGKNIDPVTNAYVNNNFSGGYTAVNLQLQLFSGFSRLNTIKQSAYNIQAAEYSKKSMELEVLTNITLTYARLLLDKEQLLLERSNIEGTQKQIEVVNEKIKVGRLTRYEFYTFNARLNTQQANLVALQNDSSAASQDIKQLLNISYKEDFDITPIDTAALSGISTTNISAGEFIESVLSNHPAIKQAQMQEQVAQMGEKIARSSLYPTLSVGGNIASNYNADQINAAGGKVPLYNQLNDNLGKNININLRIPIFSQMQNSNLVRKERINISNAQLALDGARNTIVTNTIKLIGDFNSAKERYTASKSAWDQNNLSYSLYEEKYKLGQISSMELLLAKDTQNASTLQYLQAKLQLFFQFQLMQLLKEY